jgi:hypothetical protein
MLKVLEAVHNHSASTSFAAHTAHRVSAITEETRAEISSLAQASLSPSLIVNTV